TGKSEISGVKRDIEFVSGDNTPENPTAPRVKRFDAGGNLLAGYEFANRLSFQLNAQLGLVDINPKMNDESKWRNTGFGVSLGYRF
ncbi:MAG TPA: PorT family protein, partial [Chitinophagaceae bacterium]|nr:PorT family protein [Chitinophagaceae bacterium]